MDNFDIVKVQLAKHEGTLRVVIPKFAREKLGIKAGDQLLASVDKSGKLVFRKVQSL
jgi:AbrB family looped-hinge helix DNA binding protein